MEFNLSVEPYIMEMIGVITFLCLTGYGVGKFLMFLIREN